LELIKQPTSRFRKRVDITNEELIIAEQYRTIGTNIQFIIEGEKSTILITSPGRGEGKSVTTANIALSIAQQGEEVLLIDANFRNPSLHKTFNVPNIHGFTDVLAGKITFKEAVVSSQVEGIHILTSGTFPLNLSTQKVKQLLESIKQSYNMVLIDSRPILEANDTKILANICDGVVLVVRQDDTSMENAFESKKILEYAQAKMIGVVLNEKR